MGRVCCPFSEARELRLLFGCSSGSLLEPGSPVIVGGDQGRRASEERFQIRISLSDPPEMRIRKEGITSKHLTKSPCAFAVIDSGTPVW